MLSAEQRNVVEACSTSNCVVDSVAGSGKTTTCIHVAKTYPAATNLLLTYNAKLKLDTRARVQRDEVENLEVHTYHSFCVKFYDSDAFDDLVLMRIAQEDLPPLQTFRYDRILLDETQDMTPMLYRVFCKVFRDNGTAAQLCILGDKKQSIYEFRKADARFLTLAPSIFPGAWTRLQLTTTYRLTIPMAQFVNDCMLGEERIHAVKPSALLPEYVICDVWADTILDRIVDLLRDYKPDDFFLVAPSLRSAKVPLRQLENKLVGYNVPCHVPISDDEIVDDVILEGKVSLSTIHQTKGRERKVVIVFGFDDSYYKFYKKDGDPSTCPNELYVAATRATERLILVHHRTQGFLPFLNQQKLQKYVWREDATSGAAQDVLEGKNEKPTVSVTSLLRHLDSITVRDAFIQLRRTVLQEQGKAIFIPSKTKSSTVESVSHITGTAIPSYFEYTVKGSMSILEKLAGREEFGNVSRYNLTKRLYQAHATVRGLTRGLPQITYPPTMQELLFLTNCWNAETNGYLSQVHQIRKYDWLTDGKLRECTDRLASALRRISMCPDSFEHPCIKPKNAEVSKIKPAIAKVPFTFPDPVPELGDRVLCGYADIVGSNKVMEIKCTAALTMEHHLQLALYMYLMDNKDEGYLFNVLTNELVRVQCDDLAAFTNTIFKGKYSPKTTSTDEAFIAACLAS